MSCLFRPVCVGHQDGLLWLTKLHEQARVGHRHAQQSIHHLHYLYLAVALCFSLLHAESQKRPGGVEQSDDVISIQPFSSTLESREISSARDFFLSSAATQQTKSGERCLAVVPPGA